MTLPFFFKGRRVIQDFQDHLGLQGKLGQKDHLVNTLFPLYCSQWRKSSSSGKPSSSPVHANRCTWRAWHSENHLPSRKPRPTWFSWRTRDARRTRAPRTTRRSRCGITRKSWTKLLVKRFGNKRYNVTENVIHYSVFNNQLSGISVQLLSHVWLFVIPWTAARHASLSITSSQSLLKLMSNESVMMPFNHLVLCHPLLLLPSIFPSIRVFSNESVLCIRWPKDWAYFTLDQQIKDLLTLLTTGVYRIKLSKYTIGHSGLFFIKVKVWRLSPLKTASLRARFLNDCLNKPEFYVKHLYLSNTSHSTWKISKCRCIYYYEIFLNYWCMEIEPTSFYWPSIL